MKPEKEQYLTARGKKAARRKVRSRGHPLARLAQPMGRKTKAGCCSTTNENVSTVKLTKKQNTEMPSSHHYIPKNISSVSNKKKPDVSLETTTTTFLIYINQRRK